MSVDMITNLPLHALVPSSQLWSTSLSSAPPQLPNQAPPGAQQLTLPDLGNVPHVGQVLVTEIVEEMAVVPRIIRAMSSRSGIVW